MDVSRFYADVPVGLCSFDSDLRYVHINKWLAAINGISVHEHLGRTIGDVLPDVAAGVESALRQVIETGEPFYDGTVEAKTFAQPETKRVFQHSYCAVKSDDGAIMGVTCVVQDITSRRRAEDALEESDSLYKTILEAAPQIIWHAEVDGALSYINQAWEDIIGMPKEEALGSGWARVIHPDDAPGLLAKWERAHSHGESYFGECRFLAKDGSYRTFDFVGIPVRDLSGEITRWVGIDNDITDRKSSEEQRIKLEEKARKLEAELAHMARVNTMGEMATVLAHELNQPLATIANYAATCVHSLEKGQLVQEDLSHALAQIEKQSQRAGKITNRLKRFVSGINPRFTYVCLNELVREVADLLANQMQTRRIELQLKLDDSLPHVQVDAIQIQQVLINLIMNALDAMDETEPEERQISVMTAISPEGVQVSVCDRGQGLSREKIERMFEPYFTTKLNGLGMGVNISHRIVEAHGGSLSATPNSDGGLTFQFTLASKTDK